MSDRDGMSEVLVSLYLAAIVAANLSVAYFGPSVVIVNAFLLIGLDLTVRDRLHDAWEGRGLWPRMAILVAVGGAISYLLNRDAAQIALASTVAFAAAATVDALSYAAMHRWPRLARVNGSNILSGAVDSLVFPTLAFGAFLWPIVVGQFAAKVAGGFLWSVILGRRQHDAADSIGDYRTAHRWERADKAWQLPEYVDGCPECEYGTVHNHALPVGRRAG